MTFAQVGRVPANTAPTTRLGVVALSTPAHGGTFQYTLSMIEALRLVRGFDVTIYTDSNYYENAPFPVRPLANSLVRKATETIAAALRFRLTETFVDEDILLAPIYSTALLHTRKPFAFTLHDLQERYFPQNFSFAQRSWRRILNRLMVRRATKVLCESQYVKDDIVTILGVDQQKVSIAVGPPSRQVTLEPDPASVQRTKTKFVLPDRFLFYPAHFWPHKNHLRLVEAFANVHKTLPELALVLTGRKNKTFAQVMDKAHALDVLKSIVHLGYIEPEEMAAIYRLATMLVMPSLYESVSIPIFEAFQAGTPVAASSIFAIPEQVGNAAVLFDPLSPDAIAEAVLSLANDTEKSAEFSRRGKVLMRNVTFERYASQLQLALDALVPATPDVTERSPSSRATT